MMANDSEKIATVDRANMLDGLARFPEQIKESLAIAETVERFNFLKVDNVIIAGMGASAISGDIMASLFRDKLDVPLIVNRDYDLPKWVNKDTLVVCISYSGNTDETLSSFKIAYQKKWKIDKQATIKKALANMQEMGLMRGQQDILVQNILDVETAYVIYDRHYSITRDAILKFLEKHQIHCIGRYGRWEYSGMEEGMRQGKETIERISRRS